jgi:putative peptide zinc metalloprotease protein
MDGGSAATASLPRPAQDDCPLEPLRQDVELHPGPREAGGAPSFVLRDPAAEVFLGIGARECEMLARWGLGTAAAVAAAVSRETSYRVTRDDVLALAHFLRRHGLLRGDGAALWKRSRGLPAGQRRATDWLGSLLFQRLPLGSPQWLLDRTAGLAEPFFRPAAWLLLLGVLLLALVMIVREWSRFWASLTTVASLEGMLAVSAALAAAKLLHELAHGHAARRAGAEVPVAGLSFILLVPLLYIETSAAWTVADRRRRITIAVAGVAAELIVAIAALACWPFLEPGPLRDAAGFCGTTLIVLSLAVNANPLMRFDGYFVLSEMLAIDNLQQRSQELLGLALRRWLAADPGAQPEPLPRSRYRLLLAYAIAAASWRALINIGIAALALALLPAVAGVPLAAAVIALLVVRPAIMEIATLMHSVLRRRSADGLARLTLAIGLAGAALFVPWRSTLLLPVVLEGGLAHDVFAPEPAQICALEVADGAAVHPGQRLGTLCAPDLEHQLERAQVRLQSLDRLIRQQLTGAAYHAELPVRLGEHARTAAEVAGLMDRRSRLALAAPAAGRVVVPERGTAPGRWVKTDQPLLRVIEPAVARANAYAEERELAHIVPGARARLWLDGRPLAGVEATVAAVHEVALAALDEATLATVHGGPIATRTDPGGALAPEQGVYKVRLRLAPQERLPAVRLRGYALVDTAPRSLIERLVQRAIGFWRRELG